MLLFVRRLLVVDPFVSEKTTYWAAVTVLVAVVTCVALLAFPVMGPLKLAAVMLPVLVRMLVEGT